MTTNVPQVQFLPTGLSVPNEAGHISRHIRPVPVALRRVLFAFENLQIPLAVQSANKMRLQRNYVVNVMLYSGVCRHLPCLLVNTSNDGLVGPLWNCQQKPGSVASVSRTKILRICSVPFATASIRFFSMVFLVFGHLGIETLSILFSISREICCHLLAILWGQLFASSGYPISFSSAIFGAFQSNQVCIRRSVISDSFLYSTRVSSIRLGGANRFASFATVVKTVLGRSALGEMIVSKCPLAYGANLRGH